MIFLSVVHVRVKDFEGNRSSSLPQKTMFLKRLVSSLTFNSVTL